MAESPTFCVLPWIHRFTNLGGEIQVCCTSEESHHAIPDAKGRPLNIGDGLSDEEVMNVPFMRNLRLRMLAGERPPLCVRCWKTEAGGGKSRRNGENEAYGELIPELLAETRADGAIEVRVRSADFRLGNTCNLACRMCGPRASSRWASEWQGLDHPRFARTKEELARFNDNEWSKDPAVWERFEAQLPHLRHLHFAGGEPLVLPHMAKILRLCVESGHAKAIELTYNSNVTRIPDAVKALWPEFRKVRVLASVDGFGALNEYIRHPSKWSVIDANLRDLDRGFARYGLNEVLLMCTVQVYNVLQLEPLFEYLAQGFENVAPVPNLINLYNPFYYRTQLLPPELKSLARERLLSVKSRAEARFASGQFSPRYRETLRSLDDALYFLDAEDRSDKWDSFSRVCRAKDRLRGQSLGAVVPELGSVLGSG